MKSKRETSPIIHFMEIGMWEGRVGDSRGVRAIALRCLRILVIATRGFIKDGSQKAASILTYYSMLNAVPLVAVAFAIAKGFGLEKMVEGRVVAMAESAKWQSDITSQIIGFAQSLLEQAKGGVIGGLGVVLLFYTVVTILGKIEDSLNAIWGVSKARTLARRFSDYLTMMVLAPVLLAISGSITIVVASRLKAAIDAYSSLGQLNALVVSLLGLLPYCSIWVLLTVLYLVMPNRRVPVRSAVVGGVTAGTLFQIVQWAYIKFQIGVTSYGAIYGSFAALPLFLGWLQMSWMIVLFGAELARADMYYETYGFHPDYNRIGYASQRLLALKMFHLLAHRFSSGEKPLAMDEISSTLEIPLDLVERLLEHLITVGLVAEVTSAGKKSGFVSFQPAKSLDNITIRYVLDAWEESDKMSMITNRFNKEDNLSICLEGISEAAERCQGNVLVKDL